MSEIKDTIWHSVSEVLDMAMGIKKPEVLELFHRLIINGYIIHVIYLP